MISDIDKARLELGYKECRSCAELKRRDRGIPFVDDDGNVHLHVNHKPEIEIPQWEENKPKPYYE